MWAPLKVDGMYVDVKGTQLTLVSRLAFISVYFRKPTSKDRIISEKYWYNFHCPTNTLRSILSSVFWIFPPSDTALQYANSKHNTISKYLYRDNSRHIFWASRKMHHTFWKKTPLRTISIRLRVQWFNEFCYFVIVSFSKGWCVQNYFAHISTSFKQFIT